MNTYVSITRTMLIICCLYSLTGQTSRTNAQNNTPNIPVAGQEMPQMTDEQFEKELSEAIKFLETLDEDELAELEKIGRDILISEGIDPDTLEPTDKIQETEEQPEEAPIEEQPEKTALTRPQINAREKTKIMQIISELLYHAESLVQKSTTEKLDLSSIRAWKQDLQNLIGLLLIVNKSKHIARLADKKHADLLRTIQNLHQVMHTHEPQLKTQSPEGFFDQDNPYDILALQQKATQKEIDAAFEKLSRDFDTQELRKKLQEQKLPEKDIKRKLKQAQLDFGLIEDAYEQLADPKARQQVDRQITAQQKRINTIEKQNNVHSQKITAALSKSIFTNDLVGKLKTFLQEYEPEELAKKKKRDEQEKTRIREQEKLAKQTPQMGYYGKLDPDYTIPKPTFSSDSGFGAYNSPYDLDNFDFDQFEKEWNALFGDNYGKDDTAKKDTPAPAEKSDKDKKKVKPEEAAKKKAEARKAYKQFKSTTKLMDDITKSLEKFKKVYTSEPFATFFKDMPKYTHPTAQTTTGTTTGTTGTNTNKPIKKPETSPLAMKEVEIQNQIKQFAENEAKLKDLLIDFDDLHEKLKEKMTPDQKSKYKNQWKKIEKLKKETIDRLQENINDSTSPIYKKTGINNDKKAVIDPFLKKITECLDKITEISRKIKKAL